MQYDLRSDNFPGKVKLSMVSNFVRGGRDWRNRMFVDARITRKKLKCFKNNLSYLGIV